MTPKLQKVLDAIRRGETELVWENIKDESLVLSRITAKVNLNGEVYIFFIGIIM